MFIKEKRDGAVKARGCADQITQQKYINKEDASSPCWKMRNKYMASIRRN